MIGTQQKRKHVDSLIYVLEFLPTSEKRSLKEDLAELEAQMSALLGGWNVCQKRIVEVRDGKGVERLISLGTDGIVWFDSKPLDPSEFGKKILEIFYSIRTKYAEDRVRLDYSKIAILEAIAGGER